ncbi:MAG: penicillin-binding protein 2 [Acidimicrobiia bacterium]|nr:penicillin-binding protein 2 [Acidimicrobiia bacterium]
MKLEVRLASLAVVFALLFASLFTRLWFVQIAEGPIYSAEAETLQSRLEPVAASRGDIIDVNGVLVASSVRVPAVVINRQKIPADVEDDVIQELAGVLEEPPDLIAQRFADAGSGARFVLEEVERDTAHFILTHQDRFVGVTIETVPRRIYPGGEALAHLLGHVGRVSPADLEADPELDPNGTIGKLGVEKTYDAYLQGQPGAKFFQTQANGTVIGEVGEVPAVQGDVVRLTVDMEIQAVTEQALIDAIQLSRDTVDGSDPQHGAIVVFDITDGSIVAMASYPSFDPSLFVLGLSQTEYEVLRDNQAFNNLAVQGLYPPGSTMKGITYATAVEEGIYPDRAHADSPEGSLECTGVLQANDLEESSQKVFRDPGHDIVDLHVALGASCNIYFWEVALEIWNRNKGTDRENILQRYARALGLDEPTGIDLPGEAAGVVPDRQLFEEWAESSPARLHPSRIDPGPLWVGGDLMNVAIGQGETLATPLQMAVAYGAMANGGTVWRPHVVDRIEAADGTTILDVTASATNQIEWSEQFGEIFLDDLWRTVNADYGTAERAFRAMEQRNRVGGKTGTSTKADTMDTAWFVGVAPLAAPRYVVAVVIEEGGGGGSIAAPAGRMIFQRLLGETVDPIWAGS